MHQNTYYDDHGRPDSAQMVDIHIYVVPPDLWRDNLNSAVREIINDTISAGFVRVHVDVTLSQLRKELLDQLGNELIPTDYVFLKSVGRCFTRIRAKQEHIMKAKNFAPPQTYSPELFVLEAALMHEVPYSGASSSSGYSEYKPDRRNELNTHRVIPPIIESNNKACQTDEEEMERLRLQELLREQLAEAERKRREDEERRRREEEELRRRNGEDQRRREEEERRRREEEERRRREEEQREGEEERRRREEERRRREEERRRREEEERRRKEEEERRKREEEERRRREEEERNWQSTQGNAAEKSDLLRELSELRDTRAFMEQQRDDLVRKIKMLQSKSSNRRNQARDMWKKKYFEEKKKTPPVEDQTNRLRQELDSIHRRIMSTLEGGPAPQSSRKPGDPSQQNNLKIQAAIYQHDIEESHRKVENVKMRLTAEMKLRTQAETELRALRAELTQKKINVTLTRTQQYQAIGKNAPAEHQMTPLITPRN